METAKLFLFLTDDEGKTINLMLKGSASRVMARLANDAEYNSYEECLRLAKIALSNGGGFKGELLAVEKILDIEKVNGVWKVV